MIMSCNVKFDKNKWEDFFDRKIKADLCLWSEVNVNLHQKLFVHWFIEPSFGYLFQCALSLTLFLLKTAIDLWHTYGRKLSMNKMHQYTDMLSLNSCKIWACMIGRIIICFLLKLTIQIQFSGQRGPPLLESLEDHNLPEHVISVFGFVSL